ncbi:MAG: hypothetical protein ACTSRS_12585 [Candidatus Helarchaeota archaeon]
MVLSKNFKFIIIIGCIAGGSLTIGLIALLAPNFESDSNTPPTQQEMTINKSTQITLEIDPPPSKDTQVPPIPNFTAALQNIDDFVADNLTSFVGDDQLPDFGVVYYVRIVLDWIYIYDDHDPLPLDPGEIEVQTYSMIYFNPDLVVDHAVERKFIASLENGDNYTTDIILFEGWVWRSSIILEIFDEDTMDFDDSLGYWWFGYNTSAWRFEEVLTHSDWSGGDAKIGIYQEVLGNRTTTASDVVDLMKPYLFTDVETSAGLELEDVYGRVVYGTDTLLQKNTYCVQYYFYWSAEYTFLDTFVHFWDYEPFYYFIDPSVSDRPYRIVYDNGFYWTGVPSGDEQWWKCHEYTIYEDLTLTNETAGTEIFNVNFTHELAPLIGEKQQLQFEIKSINEIFDASFQNWVYHGGVDVPVITIETSYHSFDYGNPSGGNTQAFNYIIENLTDSVIFTWFERLNTSFHGGTHSVDSQETPLYSPFCYDIMNPFQRPYISNNFDKLLNDINTFNNAKDSKFFSYEIISDIKAQLDVPVDATIKTSNLLDSNETFNPNITVDIDADQSTLTIDYALGFNVTVDWGFWSGSYAFVKNGSIFIEFSNPIIQLLNTFIRSVGGFEFSFNPTSYIQVDVEFTPQLLGTILNVTVRFQVLEILYMYLPQLRVLMGFINDFDLVINPILEGYLNMDSWTTGSQHTPHTFSNLTYTFSPTLTSPTDNSAFSIWVGNFSYGWRFYTDWRLEIDFTSILELLFGDVDFYIDLFTFPDLNLVLFSFGSDLSLCTYVWNPTFTKYVLT